MNENVSNVNVLEAPAEPRQPEPSAPPPEVAKTSPVGTVLGWLGRVIPTLLVLAALGGLAYWGHHTGWTIPKFSALAGNAEAEKDDWCSAHGVPDSQCVECKPDLLPKLKAFGWCKTHGVHECPLEHPEVAQLPAPPTITPVDLARAQRALEFAERPDNNSKCKLHQRRLQFESKEAVEKAGIDIAPAWQAPMEEAVAANGEVNYDQTRVASLSPLVAGRVWRVEKEIGQPVRKDDVLALVDAAEVGKTKAEFLQAMAQVELRSKTVERLRPLAGSSVAGKDIPEAEAALREAQIRLVSAQQALLNLGLPIRAEEVQRLTPDQIGTRMQFLGLPEDIIRTLDPKTTTANLIPVKSPLDGVVVGRKVVAGEVVDTTKTLFVVADPRQMWLTLDVRLEDAKRLSLGQPVRFLPDGNRQEARGKVAWISTAVDEKTRTVKVRADLANADGQLRAGTFGPGRIVLREEPNAVVVPNEAVQSEGDGNCQVVFVRDKNFLKEGAPKVFHVRTVRVGGKNDQNTEIIAGVLPGELVATKGSGGLRSELLKNNLGAG
jgi:cobalt-zinc-cadmium efflux system membrane fusion protein